MIKPLLKVIPTLSGNLKLACTLTNYEKVDEDTFRAISKAARIYPLSSNSFQNLIDVNLYTSSWEYDVCKYYKVYSDIFYKDTFTFDKNNLLYCTDLSSVINDRNSEFEFGCKRVSYEKTGKQLAFFAPIYCDNINDLPDSFEIELEIHNEGIYNVTKKIIVDLTNSKGNYLYSYLKRYISKLDDNVIFMLPKSKQATYYGVDVRAGGFNKYVDNLISKVFLEETTINGFDALISEGFKRNGLIVKQIIPLAFYFSVNDILSDFERLKLQNASINIKGIYTKNNDTIPFYMIDDNYDNLSLKTLSLNKYTGNLEYKYLSSNVLDIKDDLGVSVKDVEEYKYSNKLNKTYNRWMLKYSDINYPYITNNNYAFSKNQQLNNLYYEYPQNYYPTSLLCEMDMETNSINLLLPIGENIQENGPYFKYKDITSKYTLALNNYINNWFDITNEKTIDYIIENTNWQDIHEKDNKIFYKGLLYDFNNIYKTIELDSTINKFAILMYINDSKIYTNKNISNYIYANSVMTNDTTNNEYSSTHNIYSSLILPSSYTNTMSLYDLTITNEDTKVKPNYLYDNNQYFTYNEHGLGKYVDINDLGLNFYEVNKYYAISDEYYKYDIKSSEVIESYELLPIYYLNSIKNILQSNGSLLDNLYYSTTNTLVKKNIINLNVLPEDEHIFEKYLFYYKRLFISHNTYKKHAGIDDIIYSENSSFVEYIYYPSYITDSNKELFNIFIRKNKNNCFYGDNVPMSYISNDNDVLYIDPYNLKDIFMNSYSLDGSMYISDIDETNKFTYITLSNISLNNSSVLTYSDIINDITIISSKQNKSQVLDLLSYSYTYFNQEKYDYNKYNIDSIITKINGLTYCDKWDEVDNKNYSNYIRVDIGNAYYKYNLKNSSISNIVISENVLDNILNINTCAYVSNIDIDKCKIYINTFEDSNNNSYEFVLQCDENNIYQYGYLCGAMSYVIDTYIMNPNGIGTLYNGNFTYINSIGSKFPQKIITSINNLYYDSVLANLDSDTNYIINLTDYIDIKVESSIINNKLNDKLNNISTYISFNSDSNIVNITLSEADYLYNNSEQIINNEYYAKIKNLEALTIFRHYINQYAINSDNKTKTTKSSIIDTDIANYLYVKDYFINNNGNVYVNFISLNNYVDIDNNTLNEIITQENGNDYLFNIKGKGLHELYFKKSFIKLTEQIYSNIVALDDIHSKYNDLYIYRMESSNDILDNIQYNTSITDTNQTTYTVKFYEETTYEYDTINRTTTTPIDNYYNLYSSSGILVNSVWVRKGEHFTYYSYHSNDLIKSDIKYTYTIDSNNNVCYFRNTYTYTKIYNRNIDCITYYCIDGAYSNPINTTEGLYYTYVGDPIIKDTNVITPPKIEYSEYSKTFFFDKKFGLTDSLIPLFNTIYKEDKYNTVIYKDRILDKINSVVFYNDDFSYKLYRSNNYSKLMLYDVTGITTYNDNEFTYITPGSYSFIYDTKKETIIYNSYSETKNDITYTTTYLNDATLTYTYVAGKIKTYDIFSNVTTDMINITDNKHNKEYADVFNNYKLNVYKKDGILYGFYLLEMNVSNLNNMFNIIEYYNGDTNYEAIKYFTHINGINIINNHNALSDLFKKLIPALNMNMLNSLYSIPLFMAQHKSGFSKKIKNVEDETGKKHIKIQKNSSKNAITLYRYFDNIIPYIKETSNIYTEYLLKVKTLQNIKYTDSILYNVPINIYNYPGIRIYKNETEYNIIKQLEYKFYNDNRFINLNEEITIHISDNLKYDELLEYQNDSTIIHYFKNYINTYKNTVFNDIEILFLFKKYNVLLLSYHNKLNYNFTEKLYSLTYKFKLK